ncbi:cation diffusion facilitator family transporter [bacterium]|nr:cation diffusion facilitator family transporter [bacterium]
MNDDSFIGPAPYDAEALAHRRRIMLGVLALSSSLMLVKLAAFGLTGSRALLSDALESIVNVLTGAFGLFSVWLAARPPDRSHPYGHGRVEFFAAGLEGGMILLAALGIVRESLPRLVAPAPLENVGFGAALAAAAGVVNGLVGAALARRGRKVHSETLAAEGKHLLTDTVTTVGVLSGVGLVQLTGWLRLDPIAACVVAVSIAWTGIGLLRRSASALMDHAEPELLRNIVAALDEGRRAEWIEIHLLRAWRSGDLVHVDFHLAFPRFWSMEKVHASQQALLDFTLRRLGRPGEVMVHPDPCTPRLCGQCRMEECPVRATPFAALHPWTVDFATGGPAGADVDGCQLLQANASRDNTRLEDETAGGAAAPLR